MQATALGEDMRAAQQAAQQPARTSQLVSTVDHSLTKFHERSGAQQQDLQHIIDIQESIQASLGSTGIEGRISDLAQLMEAKQSATERVTRDYERVATALQRALTQEALTTEESLALFRSSRRSLLVREKVASMAHIPCQTSPRGLVTQSEEHHFTIKSTNADDFLEVPYPS